MLRGGGSRRDPSLGALFSFIATLGAAALIFELGGSLGADEPHRYPHYRESSAQAQSAPAIAASDHSIKPFEEKEPCRNSGSRDESNLCATWRATYAAEQSARWTRWQAILAVVGIAGLGFTLWFNLEAWRQARQSEEGTIAALGASQKSADATARLVDVSEMTAKRQLRAYVAVSKISFKVKGDQGNSLIVSVYFTNMGRTPAYRVTHSVNVSCHVGMDEERFERLWLAEQHQSESILPRAFTSNIYRGQWTEEMKRLYPRKEMSILVMGTITYTDAFGDVHSLCFEVMRNKDIEDRGVPYRVIPSGNYESDEHRIG